MLTKEAFNALLKTLEEPPANVKFIFCTTDPQKVPDTILSRCQRFDFGTIATATIGQRLTEIAALEGVAVDPKAVQLVARRAAGSMRDSQSLFDQLLAFGGKTIGAADVHRLLGTAPDERLVDLGQALINRERARVLELFAEALQSGVQISELTEQLLAYFRDLMVLACGAADAPLLSLGDEQRSALAKQAAAAGLQTILAALQILAETKHRMKGATFSRVLLELALIRIGSLEQLDDLGELVVRLRQGPGGLGGMATQSVARVTSAPVKAGSPAAGSVVSGQLPVASGAPQCNPTLTDAKTAILAEKSTDLAQNPVFVAENGAIKADPDETVVPGVRIPLEPGRENEILSQVLSLLSDMAKSNAKNASSVAISGPNTLVLKFPKSYHFSKQFFDKSPDQLKRVEKAVEQVVGRPVQVSLAVDESTAVVREPARETNQEKRPEAAPVVRPAVSAGENRGVTVNGDDQATDAERDPLVQRAISVFAARVVKTERGTAPPVEPNS